MYVCCCNAVTDREVADAIDSGARTRAEVTRACGAGGDCGACHVMIEDMIDERSDRKHCAAVARVHEAKVPGEGEPLLPAAALVRGRAA